MRDVTSCISSLSALQWFLLTRPMRDVTNFSVEGNKCQEFLLTRPMRDVTTGLRASEFLEIVSTHTPHAGRD